MSHCDCQDCTDTLGDLFVNVTGNDTVTERQEEGWSDRELPEESDVEEAIADGLDDAIDGAERDAGDPGG